MYPSHLNGRINLTYGEIKHKIKSYRQLCYFVWKENMRNNCIHCCNSYTQRAISASDINRACCLIGSVRTLME